MASIVSGLGRLFHPVSASLAPNSSRGPRQLESVTEEAHTYDLLYSEVGYVQRTQHHTFPLKHGDPSSIVAAANSSDERGGLNIQHPRDVRFMVGQYIGGQSRILFDTQPSLISSSNMKSLDCERNAQYEDLSTQANVQRSRTAPHTRQSSLSQNMQSVIGPPGLPLSPVNEMTGLFGRETRRPNTSDGETIQAQLAREERQETDAMLSSIFGAIGHRVSAGMKVHIKPYTSIQPEAVRPMSPGNSRHGSQRRRTPLTRSTTAEDLHSFVSTQNYNSTIQQASRRQSSSILVTKIFYLDSADEDLRPVLGEKMPEPVDNEVLNMQSPSEMRRIRALSADQSGQTLKRYRTPAFAIAVVIYVPLHQMMNKMPASARASPGLGQSYLVMSPENSSQLSTEAFDRSVEYILAHWDMIIRALSSLEIIVRCEISDALSQLDIDIPIQPPNMSPHASSLKTSRMKAQPLHTLQLPQGALQQSVVVQKALEMTGQRVISALQIRGVAVGQGRWGVWREEARGVGNWAGGREHNFFFFNLLTAFLGNHTEWLDVMSSKLSRGKRSRSRDQLQHQQHNIIRHRTVIVSPDKMAARRLIFLLSAFLPPTPSGSKRQEEPRSEAPISTPTLSTSPLTGSFISHQLSHRRSVNRNQFGHGWRGSSDNDTTIQELDTATELSDDRTITESPIIHRKNNNLQHPHNSSDAASARSIALPITATGPRFRPAGTTTTATVLPECAVPVAHFSNILPESRLTAAVEQRPGSSGSIASLALHRTLSRSDSVDHSGTSADSHSTGRWFWNSRRGSSTETSETPISSAEGLGIFVPKDLRAPRPTDKLSSMVDDAVLAAAGQNTPRAHTHASQDSADASSQASHPKDIPQGKDSIEPFPLNLSVNESDGVIDVKIPSLDSQASSFGSFVGSPRASRMAPNGFKESLRPPSPSLSTNSTLSSHRNSHSVSEVAGWLRKFHQDLTLQAVQPYDTLKEEIKQAMRTEPVPATIQSQDGHNNVEDWTDVCVSLIADTTTFTLTRITLRRKNASLRHHQADALLGLSTKDNPDEEFVEESLIEHDVTLTEAVEKILSDSGQSSRFASHRASRVPSRPSSPTRYTEHAGEKTTPLEIPKSECKRMVLGALEQVAKSVRSEMAGATEFQIQDENEAKDPLREGVRRWFAEVGLTAR